MKKFLVFILFLFFCPIYGIFAQGKIILFDESFKFVKKEKKAFYFSKDSFEKKGEEKLVLIPMDGTERVIGTFFNGNFVRKERHSNFDNSNAKDLEKQSTGTLYNDVNDVSQLETIPVPIGGTEAFNNFSPTKTKQLEEAIDNKLEGRVYVKFIVTKTGGVADVEVVKSTHKDLDDIAIQQVKEFGEKVGWDPGTMDGKPVNTWMIMPFFYKLGTKK